MKEVGKEDSYEKKQKDSWIQHYAKCAIKRIDPTASYQKSWQDEMMIIIKDKILNEFIKNTSMQDFEELKSLQLNDVNINQNKL